MASHPLSDETQLNGKTYFIAFTIYNKSQTIFPKSNALLVMCVFGVKCVNDLNELPPRAHW